MKTILNPSIFFIIITFISTSVLPQAPDTLWTKTFGGTGYDLGTCVQQTSDSGYVLIGSTQSYGVGEDDFWLIKTDEAGDTLWTKTYGGHSYDYGYSVQQTFDGGYILTGETYSFPFNDWNGWLIKTDAAGDTIWTKVLGRNNNDDFARFAQQTSDSGYIVVGYTRSYGAGNEDAWLIKTDIAGDTLWTKTYGGIDGDWGFSVQQTENNGYIIAGGTESFGSGDRDVWLIKTDTIGDTIWTLVLGGADNDFANFVEQTSDSGYIVTGHTRSFGSGNHDVWLIKIDKAGDTTWTKTFGGIESDWGSSVQQTKDSGYIITGMTASFATGYQDVWLIKTDVYGDTIWTKTFGGNDYDRGYSVQQTNDDGYIITGVTQSFGAGDRDAWLIKTTSDPNKIDWDISINNPKIYHLKQNFPNPFNPSTKIKYSLLKSENVKIEIFNLLGQKIETLLNGQMPAGLHEIEFTDKNLPSGIYLYRIQAGEYHEVKKMILLK